MRKQKLLVIFCCLLFFTTTISPVLGINDNTLQSKIQNNDTLLDRILTRLMHIGHIPSLSTCIINNDQVIWSHGYGYSNLENETPTTENTIYMVCSISKTITGMALMQLYDQGLFALDDDVNDYLPFPLRNPNFPNNSITFRMILSHSSSLRSDPASFYWLNYSAYPPISWYPYPWIEEYIVPGGNYYVPEIWHDTNRPGERAQYANANFVIAAYLVELLSGESFIDYCDNHIFAPLDMKHASFNLVDFNLTTVAIPYHFYQGTYHKITEIEWGADPPLENYYRMLHYPVGGLYTSVIDLSHFLIAHMNNGVYNGTQIISEDALNEMHTNQPPYFGYGLAWYYSGTFYGRIFSGHEGDIPGYHNSMFMQHPDYEHGVIFYITGDRYSILGRNMALLIRNILFMKANFLTKSEKADLYQEYNLTNIHLYLPNSETMNDFLAPRIMQNK